MTIEIIRAFTPYVTFFLVLVVGVIGFFLKWMITQNQLNFTELGKKISGLEKEIREIDKTHQNDQRSVLQEYVDKESYYMFIGEQKNVIKTIFDRLDGLAATMNQTIGALKERKDNG